jgi:hypothetical protein
MMMAWLWVAAALLLVVAGAGAPARAPCRAGCLTRVRVRVAAAVGTYVLLTRTRRTRRNTFVLLGLTNGGKTALFYRVRSPRPPRPPRPPRHPGPHTRLPSSAMAAASTHTRAWKRTRTRFLYTAKYV